MKRVSRLMCDLEKDEYIDRNFARGFLLDAHSENERRLFRDRTIYLLTDEGFSMSDNDNNTIMNSLISKQNDQHCL